MNNIHGAREEIMLSDFELGYEAAIRRLRGISPSTRINTNHEGQHWMRLCALYLEEYKEIDVASRVTTKGLD